jgi:DNA mismatch repair protein MutL
MTEIQPLPQDVVKLMAAGEVIDSPAAAVRELVENALDAGASRIVVEVRSPSWYLQVTDNGSGMPLDTLRQAATPHSTSKLATKADLWNIRTLGFRGEALHSLSRLSRLTLCSRPQAEDTSGFCVACDRTGRPICVSPIAMAPGTRIQVADLFYPLPTRQQAAPSDSQRFRAVQQVIYALALCHPGVTWQVLQGDRPWFTLWSGSSALQVLPQILPRIQVTDLREVYQTVPLPDATGELYLLLGLPDRCHRPRPDGIFIGLNGRPVHLFEVTTHLLTILRRSLPRDRYPVLFLHLHAAPHQIDWHRAPDKSQVYLQHVTTWLTAIEAAITTVLQSAQVTLPPRQAQEHLTQLLRLAEPGSSYGQAEALSTPDDTATNSTSPLALKAIAQVHQRYILAEHPAGLCLIEQHIAHERVLYEALCDRWELVELSSPLVLPQLTPTQVEQLQRLGLSVEPFGADLWAIRTVPAPLRDRPDCSAAIQELSLGGDLEAAIVATACRTAIRNGTPLSLEVMQDLLTAWQRTRHPQTCPHGRPICLTLNESSLARYFRRSWVIGKSHGL